MSTARPPNKRTKNIPDAAKEAVLESAARQFARHGYQGAQLEEIVRLAGVTTGAVYHHFRNKKDLFKAVAVRMEQEILSAVQAAASTESDPWARLRKGIAATLELSVRPDLQRIVYVDAPTVFGPSAWRDIEMRYAYGLMHAGVSAMMENGLMKKGPPEVICSMLLGAIIEGAAAVARSEDKKAAIAQARGLLDGLVNSLKA